MKEIYIDHEFKCHTENPNGVFRKFVVEFFKDKCKDFIEAHRYVPKNESWTRSDGFVFHGEMIARWNPCAKLDDEQREYERQLLTEQAAELENMRAALRALNVEQA